MSEFRGYDPNLENQAGDSLNPAYLSSASASERLVSGGDLIHFGELSDEGDVIRAYEILRTNPSAVLLTAPYSGGELSVGREALSKGVGADRRTLKVTLTEGDMAKEKAILSIYEGGKRVALAIDFEKAKEAIQKQLKKVA